jgi:hypothetical protein
MLLNAVELQSYLHCAFDHFALTLEEAFDFVQASFLNNPIPMDFGGNILRLVSNPRYGIFFVANRLFCLSKWSPSMDIDDQILVISSGVLVN